MNKTELLAALAAKYYAVGTSALVSTTAGLGRYTVECFDRSGDTLRRASVDYYVQNEGAGNEAAFWNIQPPSALADVSFQRDCEAYIAAKITDGTIRAAFIVHLDSVRETAVAWGYRFQSPNLLEVKVLLRRVSGAITHEIINTVLNTGG